MLRRALQRASGLRAATTATKPQAASIGATRFYIPGVGEDNKTSIQLEVEDGAGSLQDILKFFWKHDVNMTRIESRPAKGYNLNYNFFIDFDGKSGDAAVDALLDDLRRNSLDVMILHDKKVPWFPRKINELDRSVSQVLDAGSDLESDHPGFNDQVYRARRNVFAKMSDEYRQGDPIPRIDYTDDEIRTWGIVYKRMKDFWKRYACDEFNYILPLLETNCGYAENNIPQQQDISNFLKECTGFTLRPVGGLLSSRDFLNGLAFRVFFSTQCYWFSVEFGLIKQKGEYKAYGAGLLSSFGEMEYACSKERPAGGVDHFPEYRAWDPFQACNQDYPITTYQPVYYAAESLADARERMREFCEDLKKPFHARYNHMVRPFLRLIAVSMLSPRQHEALDGKKYDPHANQWMREALDGRQTIEELKAQNDKLQREVYAHNSKLNLIYECLGDLGVVDRVGDLMQKKIQIESRINQIFDRGKRFEAASWRRLRMSKLANPPHDEFIVFLAVTLLVMNHVGSENGVEEWRRQESLHWERIALVVRQ
ncbi:hypothetical protein Poli38472_014919 [Pythium oligandrum]|uniref:phenylalanine 4-monooxygenase n=1 Tax=Pythium oligandrum TaxID=41045 RepID=A0A8K1FMP6_PYTOL|nr:hypothetical protein Poli38472_014919 [Pythium oligandrum]|eukprot:TMW63868.1 hypothetical protein Poli38472_014919 [Pythium oligandrum]